mgnify:CR=1 FL=1
MTKYIINETFHGYEKITVDNIDTANTKDNLYIIIVDSKCDEKVADYYKFINTALRNHNKIILISITDENKCFRPLASLMITFSSYNIYEVDSRESLSANYLKTLEEREPDYCEVQTYIGGDLTAFSDMSMILFGIESLVEEGNEEALKSFLEEHMLSIENLTTSLNSMKKTCEMFNSNELVNEVNSLKDKEKKLNKAVADKEESLKDVKHERDENKVAAENLKRENEKLKEKTKELQEQSSSGGSTITSFKTTSTQLLKGNKTKIVLYFKEISYVRYTNTLVSVIFDYLKRKGLKTKMLIYDTGSELYSVYNPLRVVTGNDYITDKGNLVNKIEKFVVAEPSQMIIEDVLTSEQAFDVVIIYDRMHTQNDVVEGNLVSKFYVMNSKKDYESLKSQLKINDVSFIITDAANSLNISKEWKIVGDRNFIDIPTIPEYKKHEIASSSFGFSKYMKQATSTTKEGIIDTIIKKSKINTLYSE